MIISYYSQIFIRARGVVPQYFCLFFILTELNFWGDLSNRNKLSWIICLIQNGTSPTALKLRNVLLCR